MTSNLGSNYLLSDSENKYEEVNALLKQVFKPEFLNRIDDIIFFNKLDTFTINKIYNKFVSELQNRLDQKGIILKISDKAKNKIIENGYNPLYGARPLKRYIEKEIESLLAYNILKFPHSNKFNVDYAENKYVISSSN